MNRDYYKKYYSYEREHWWFKVRSNIIEDKVRTLTNGLNNLNILNIGVATGKTTEMLSQYGNVLSVEYDKDCCEFLKEELNIEVINGSITELPFNDNSFDLVFALDVIEHIEDDQKGINEMHRVCKKNGVVFITVPAFMSLWSEHDEVNQHYRRYVLSEIKSLFKHFSGLEVYSSYFNSVLFIPIYLIRFLMNIFKKNQKSVNSNKSDFEVLNNSLLNKIAYSIFSIERLLLKYCNFPFGVSIIYIFRR